MSKVSFPEFFLIWGELQGWDVPDFHLEACEFLQLTADLKLLMLPRGHNKSGLLDVYNAWRYYNDPDHLLLHQGATDPDAYKVSRGTENVLDRHPLTQDVKKIRGETQKWWVNGSEDVRYGSMHARGILSNVTGARAIEIQNDDIEVPGNIGTPEAREKLRYRLSEQTHILIPGGSVLYVGTPHTHDSLYTDVKALGAKCLIRPMYQKEVRFVDDQATLNLTVWFKPEYIFASIGKNSKLLVENKDYTVEKKGERWHVHLVEKHNLIDCYAQALWPERFTRKEMQLRRRKCRTLNEWDSQYQLHAKPIGDVRLNPDRLMAYACEPVIRQANKVTTMWLGQTQISSATLRWDPSSGKLNSDASSIALVLQDLQGRIYWHRTGKLTGQIAEFDEKGRVIGGQVWQLCDIIEKFQLGRIVIETNGVGTHIPAIMKGALKARRLRCGVTEHHATQNKNKRILGAIEAPLTSGYLWAHISVLEEVNEETGESEDSEAVKQMRMWNAGTQNQDDDYLDALAGAISDEPVKVGKIPNKRDPEQMQDWRTTSGQHKVALDFN